MSVVVTGLELALAFLPFSVSSCEKILFQLEGLQSRISELIKSQEGLSGRLDEVNQAVDDLTTVASHYQVCSVGSSEIPGHLLTNQGVIAAPMLLLVTPH